MDKSQQRRRGTVYYDDSCGLCSRLVARWRRTFERRGYAFMPASQAVAEGACPAPRAKQLESEMLLETADGEWFGGIDAWILMAASVPWMWPAAQLARCPGLHGLCAFAYRTLARHRHCILSRG